MSCENCGIRNAMVVRPKNRMKVCKDCFIHLFEEDIHDTIIKFNMFNKGEKVGIGISGGKDSIVLSHVLNTLNERHNYGLDLKLLCIDEGIIGYRDKSIEAVNKNKEELGLSLKVLSFKEMFGYSMDNIVEKVGKKGNCTYCGIFRRQALEDAGRKMGVDCIVTGHNANDVAETVILNIIRGDISRLKRCTLGKTMSQDVKEGVRLSMSRVKPFKHTYQKEIVLYAFYKKLKYFSTECTYSPGASRGDVRMLMNAVEKVDPSIILKIIESGDQFISNFTADNSTSKCISCFNPTSSNSGKCGACILVEKLNSIDLS